MDCKRHAAGRPPASARMRVPGVVLPASPPERPGHRHLPRRRRRCRAMDRRGLRAIVVLAAAAVVGFGLVVTHEQGGRTASAAGASGGPDLSMAGPTTF